MSYGGGNRGQGGGDRGYDDRRHDNRGDRYDNRDRNYDNRSRGQDDRYGNDRRDDRREYGSTYSTHSDSSSSGRGRGNYQGGGGRGSNYQDDLSGRMDNMSMGGGGRGGGGYRGGGRGGGMYDQHSNRGGQSRVQRNDGATMGDLAGSAQHPNAPVPKKNLAHTKQAFYVRPSESVYDKKAVGIKTELWTNHALVLLPDNTLKLWCYNVDVYQNNKKLIKREEAGPIFHQILRDNRKQLSPRIKYIFNDVNMLWTTDQLPSAQATYRSKRMHMELKHCGRVDFGRETREEQDIQLLSTLVDAIATANVRTNCPKYIVFKRCMYMIQGASENPSEVLDFPLTVPLRNGLDARVGISMAVRLNLRAGITACFDVAHTIFSRPGYSLILLFCELINDGVIDQEEFENIWDQRLRTAVCTYENKKVMSAILKKMRLQYSFEAGVEIDEHGSVVRNPSLFTPVKGGKSFKFHELTVPASEHRFFDERAGREYTVEEYFLKAKNIRLRYPNLPMLLKKPTKQNRTFIAFPMELVSFEACKRFEGAMSTELKADLIKYTSYEAPQRFHLLERIVGQQRIADVPPAINNDDDYMKATGLEISKEMLSVKATILPAPTVVYGEGSTFKDVDHVGEWEAITHNPIRKVLEDSTFVRNKDPNAPKLKKRLIGSILEISSPKFGRNEMHYDAGCYHRLMCAIDNAGQPIAWENKERGQAAIQGIHKYCQTNESSTPYSIVQFFESLKANIDQKYKENDDEVLIPFVLVIFEVRCSLVVQTLNGQCFNDYNFMKYHGDNEKGIYTQGILLRNFSEIGEVPATCKLTRLLVEKVLGKIGTTHRKLERGGDFKPWTMLTNPDDPVLLLGVDVSHPSTAEREYNDIRKLSAAAVVGNIDFNCTEFRASCRIQQVGEERIVRFQEEIQARIHDFIAHTGKRPNHIVMYRDGFSEGEFQRTLYEERLAIEQACVDTAPKWYPSVTYIVATKRHHTRFFLKDFSQGTEANGFNIVPGTLVEDTVTTNEYYDFFLCSQVGEKGVARPTHYYVLHNTWEKLPVSFWPCITYALTYNFCRTTSTVAQPAPLLYAHLAAKRAKEALDGAWSTAQMKGEHLNVDNVFNVNQLTAAINVNKGLDGMIFV
ncbi:hypothetical protein CAEBREN_23692 [Caenorhabditis brenneri]|uniref:Uncharacterized protein n=1 Tax=Caenorhabditis brenneri TaxID=135651 RepID=G0NBJ4_CAEBE|nr:hypothetical protein CAEBREN_23692 [Caenorhabditis brenneri]